MTQAQTVARQIGIRIRAARREHGLTLMQLGAATGLSAAFLSRIERGEAGASIANLIAVSTTLGLSLRDLFGEGGDAAGPTQPYAISRRAERRGNLPVQAKGYTYHHLSDELAEPRISAFLLEFPVGTQQDVVLQSHDGEEILFLLEGRIEFQIGADRFTLEAGDSVHFQAEQPHMGRNIGRVPARMLMTVTPPHGHQAPKRNAMRGKARPARKIKAPRAR